MKELGKDTTRYDIVHSHLNEGRNVLPECPYFCMIPNNVPFLFQIGDQTGKSLHTLLTSQVFDIESEWELDEQYRKLFFAVKEFSYYLYETALLDTTYKSRHRSVQDCLLYETALLDTTYTNQLE